MTDQQYLPPKPTDEVGPPASLDQLYPTPPPEPASPYAQPYQQQPYQQPYQQQPPVYQQQPDYQQPPHYQQQPDSQQQPYYQQPYYQQQGYQAPREQFASNHTLFLVLSILSVLLCGGVFAIPALVFAIKMNSAHKIGDKMAYDKAKKNSLIWLIVAVCIGLIANIVLITSMF